MQGEYSAEGYHSRLSPWWGPVSLHPQSQSMCWSKKANQQLSYWHDDYFLGTILPTLPSNPFYASP